MKHKSKELIINTPSITFWRVVSPRLVWCRLSLRHDVELNQEVCKGKEIAYFMKIYPSEASPSWRWPWWDRQGCFFMDPSWVEPSVHLRSLTLRGLKSPSMWMYNSTTYRNHAKNLRVSNCVCTLQTPPFTFICNCFTFRCYTLRIACVG